MVKLCQSMMNHNQQLGYLHTFTTFKCYVYGIWNLYGLYGLHGLYGLYGVYRDKNCGHET